MARRADVLRTIWLDITPDQIAALLGSAFYRRGPVRFAALCFIQRHTRHVA